MKKDRITVLSKDFILLCILVILDQLTKYFAVLHLKNQESFICIPNILQLTYLENRGAAFGMMQNQKVFFIFITIIILGIIIYILGKAPLQKKYSNLHIALIFIASGAIGNLIDRIRLNYVVDFIYFVIIRFPVFNIADIYVSVSSCFLIVLLCFVYKEHDLDFLSLKTKRYREIK